ncbi:hypothetical protein HID58_025477 [Brassica napus]|uniref:Uncharacterized protein n=1 Tax=Brassica napus TaxID=3708 RepID=A0ABQ8CL77_BRANA|nr:hypothetical protein HID58_025477 [Brassica napus]
MENIDNRRRNEDPAVMLLQKEIDYHLEEKLCIYAFVAASIEMKAARECRNKFQSTIYIKFNTRERREKVDLRLDPAIGRRVSVRAVAGFPRVTIEVLGSRSPTSPLPSALPELCYRSHPWWICRWSKGADVWRVSAMKLGAWLVVFLFPGGGGYYSSIAAGLCFRG